MVYNGNLLVGVSGNIESGNIQLKLPSDNSINKLTVTIDGSNIITQGSLIIPESTPNNGMIATETKLAI